MQTKAENRRSERDMETGKREIKFRAWDGKEMLSMPLNKNFGISRFFGILGETDIVMQFTGLHDKNGKGIFEGDILNGSMFQDEYNPYKVVFEDCAFRRENRKWPDGLPKPYLSKSEIEILHDVVIGNIHQNPELIT